MSALLFYAHFMPGLQKEIETKEKDTFLFLFFSRKAAKYQRKNKNTQSEAELPAHESKSGEYLTSPNSAQLASFRGEGEWVIEKLKWTGLLTGFLQREYSIPFPFWLTCSLIWDLDTRNCLDTTYIVSSNGKSREWRLHTARWGKKRGMSLAF